MILFVLLFVYLYYIIVKLFWSGTSMSKWPQDRKILILCSWQAVNETAVLDKLYFQNMYKPLIQQKYKCNT